MNATKRYGLLGYPLGHSLSPQIHTRLMELAGISGTYEPVAVPPAEIVERLPGLLQKYDGLNVTIPYKRLVMPFLDRIDAEAERVGAVNTILREKDGGTAGYNTDLGGFMADGPTLAHRRVLILGSGGVSRTLAYAAGRQGAHHIRFLVRSPEKARDLVSHLGRAFPTCRVDLVTRPEPGTADCSASLEDKGWILLNGTPVGMWPETAAMPIPDECLDHVTALYDTIYNPCATRLVLRARSRNIPAQGGLGMLVGQALLAQKLWNPTATFPEDSKSRVLAGLAAEIYRQSPLTIVLMGFMGSGKSRLGRELAAKIVWPLVDLDQRVEETAGRTIPEIFASQGEEAFRLIEQACLEDCLAAGRCQILATGGGALLSESAQAILKRHPVLVVFLDASLATIESRVGDGAGRPLLAGRDREHLARLYAERRPVYARLADLTISADRPLSEKLDAIVANLELGGETR